MFAASEVIPVQELAVRRRKCLELLQERQPQAGGMFVFSRINIYYFTGTFAIGALWLPLAGSPVLFVRKGMERALLEAPGLNVAVYKSYSELPGLAAEYKSPLTRTLAVEQNGLNWSLGLNLAKKLVGYAISPADDVLARVRSVKSPWEQAKLRICGSRQHQGQCVELPACISVGMSEYEISRRLWDIFFSKGHSGLGRMAGMGEESFLGVVCTGENSLYPNYYNGPIGVKGVHPAATYMGFAGSIWKRGEFLVTDLNFTYEGYNTDKTQAFFAGKSADMPVKALRAHECCLNMQYVLASDLKPGAVPQELYRKVLAMADKAGFAEGFMGIGGNRVPFVGHGIGLNVDEFPVFAERFVEPLQAGMAVALEPKISVPGVGMLGVENVFIIGGNRAECITLENASLTDTAGAVICIE